MLFAGLNSLYCFTGNILEIYKPKTTEVQAVWADACALK